MTGARSRRERRWPRLAGWAAIFGGLAVAWLVAAWQPAPLVALGGVALTGAGVVRRTRWLLSIGGPLTFGSVAVAGLVGAGPTRTLLAGTLAVVAWDSGRYAHELAADCSPAANPIRVQVIHVCVVTAGLAGVATVTSLLFAGLTGGQSMLGLLGLLVGVFASLVALQQWVRPASRTAGE